MLFVFGFIINIYVRLFLIISDIVTLNMGIAFGNNRSSATAFNFDTCSIKKDTFQILRLRVYPLRRPNERIADIGRVLFKQGVIELYP